ncbi:2OG-Fe(II)-dependent halogenase WelO5 family protein [Marinitenerispora sediminis]|uniref:Proline hydroxylase n=1 Tax=Marinitenerispora sediminis TaxID=1931232 RepID=A0A368T008_9ACTN|nr:2OG-Fe(II) oxygenase [Marinitenerispora sediminis]RCV51000.1 proline hydroxylase [Marinitenerispora sediminis]RCV52237.1 proline hydroxylase [Marinitenerispora sediminis]RCV53845.1 proline hydroxylase [Marinitenerispora sediminis]
MLRTALDPLFTAVDAPAFTDRHVANLAAGTLAAVRVADFLDPAACAATLSAMARLPTAHYDAARVPQRIARFGPALNDYRTPDGALDAERYWPDADAARAAWEHAGMRPDPVALALARIGDAWRSPVEPAAIGGRPVFGGTLREINTGALIHYDDVNREFPRGVFDQDIVAQLAFNLWVAVPETGGATTVWRHRWEPVDEHRRDAYGYRPEVVDHCQRVSLVPRLGDALLFNPANFHAVEPSSAGRRIAFAFFLALTTTGRLVTWS